jgi:hypothetical protein
LQTFFKVFFRCGERVEKQISASFKGHRFLKAMNKAILKFYLFCGEREASISWMDNSAPQITSSLAP